MHPLTSEYSEKKHKIKQRLKTFDSLREADDKDIFSELCFCILTPQSRAVYCEDAIRELRNSGLLFKGTRRAVRQKLKKVRFPNNKTDYLIYVRGLFGNGDGIDIKKKLNANDIPGTRDWLVRNIKGLGYKEASHFLRNVGFGKDIAILDVHILRNLKKYKVIREIPSSISKKAYLDIENRMRKFAEKINIPLEELDLLFWSSETGFIFK